LNRHVRARDQAVRRLTTMTRTVAVSAVAGSGLLALVAARTSPGRSAQHIAAPSPLTPTTVPEPVSTAVPATTAPTTVVAAPGRVATSHPGTTVVHRVTTTVTSPPTTARPVVRHVAPVATTAPPVVISGGS
jgi:hypothetical protein